MIDLRALNRYRNVQAEQAKRVHLGLPPPSEDDLFYEGVFEMLSRSDPLVVLRVIASNGADWDHVSVSTEFRCPTWTEMEQIKRLFFQETEEAMQLHVQPRHHISIHPYVLHLWRPQARTIPLPPHWMVG